MTDWLQTQDELPSARRGLLLPDIIVQVSCALAWAIATLVFDDWRRWAAAGLIAVPLLQVAVTDLRHRYVYTVVAAVGGAIGVGAGWLIHGGEWWYGLVGAAGGFISFAAIYGIGRLLYRGREPLARGDITIAAMIGAGAGLPCTLNALVIGVLCSGLFAVGILVTRRKSNIFMPYGPGLCLGGLITLFRC